MSGREAINYAARARASLSLALTCFEPFYGLLRPGEDIAFQHTSILVRPRHIPRQAGEGGGAAGYCPRVRCAYYTTRFITIAGRTRPDAYGASRRLFQPANMGSRRHQIDGFQQGNRIGKFSLGHVLSSSRRMCRQEAAERLGGSRGKSQGALIHNACQAHGSAAGCGDSDWPTAFRAL